MSKNFGKYLSIIRKNSGFKTLDQAVKNTPEISKSLLNLYELGKVQTISPSNLKILARAYKIPYQELAKRWIAEKYKINFQEAKEGVSLIPSLVGDYNFEIYPVTQFIEEQKKLHKGSQVGIYATTLIDEKIYFELVSDNIAKGVSYYYIAPQEEKSKFTRLVNTIRKQIAKSGLSLKGEIDFFPRPKADIPISFIIFKNLNSELSAFIALPIGKAPTFYQKASLELTYKLYEIYRWVIFSSADKDFNTQKSIALSAFELEKIRKEKIDLSFK